jgi:hypothetical protein
MKTWMGTIKKQNNIDLEKAFAVVVKTGRTMFDFEVFNKQDFGLIGNREIIEAWY